MLANKEVIKLVSKKVKQYNVKNLVLDPVMVAKSGDYLLQMQAQNALISDLLPLAYVVTPNIYEAEALTEKRINSIEEMKISAKMIHNMGVKKVIIKGGSLIDDKNATDLFYDGNKYLQYQSDRVDTNNTHGSGCTFASAIAAEIGTMKVYEEIHVNPGKISFNLVP